MRVSEAMTRDVRVADPGETIRQAAQTMAQIDAGVLPVGENDRLVGMITDRDIAVRAVREAPPGFHARFHARGKRYAYRCLVGGVRPAIGRYLYHWVRRPVDLAAMREAASCLRGPHDFASFATNPGYARTRGTVRTLEHVHLVERPRGFDFAVQGTGFLYNMVRNLVGSLLEVGYGNQSPHWLREVLAAKDRTAAGPTAPPHGLYLLRVLYARDLSPAGVEPGREVAEDEPASGEDPSP